MPRTPDRLPLAGLKVIDVTLARAGPTAVRHLADWGADVIRIDGPLPPEGTAAFEDVTGREHGSDYQNLHRNKRSMRLNLKDPAGLAILKELVKDADVFIENMRPAVKERLGITYEQLRSVNPRLVYGSISGFGQHGPYRDRPGFDPIAQGMSGLMSVTGLDGAPPTRTGIAVGDLGAGTVLALNVMMALYERDRTGEGRWVHTSLMESLMFMLDFQVTRWLIDGEVPRSVGNNHPTATPNSVFATSDGHVMISASNSRMWPRFCTALGHPEWTESEQWGTSDKRRARRAELNAAIEEITLRHSSAYWIDSLNAAGVTCGPIYTMDQVFADEQIQELEIAAPVEHPSLGRLHLVASPMNFDGAERRIRLPTPDSGQHTDEILQELGYSDSSIRELRAARIC